MRSLWVKDVFLVTQAPSLDRFLRRKALEILFQSVISPAKHDSFRFQNKKSLKEA
jgi:hypothetical protein